MNVPTKTTPGRFDQNLELWQCVATSDRDGLVCSDDCHGPVNILVAAEVD